MIRDAFERTTEKQELPADICIVGSGAAGLAMAHRFIGTKKSVIVLESSRYNDCQVTSIQPPRIQPHRYEDPMVQRVYGGWLNGKPDPVFFSNGRARCYGGSTNCWEGWTRPLAGSDFDQSNRSHVWIWPKEVEQSLNDKYYAQAMAYCSFGKWPFDCYRDQQAQYDAWIKEAAKRDITLATLDAGWIGSLETAVIMQIAEQDQTGARQDGNLAFQFKWGREIEEADNVTIYRNANVRYLEKNNGNRVKATTLTANGRNTAPDKRHSFYVKADQVILAASCIENARLLLHSGYKQQALGRYLMDHPRLEKAATFYTENWPSEGIFNFYSGKTRLYRGANDDAESTVVFAVLASTEWVRNTTFLPGFRARLSFGVKGDENTKEDRSGSIDLLWEKMPSVDNQVTLRPNSADPVFGDPLPDVTLTLDDYDRQVRQRALEDVSNLLLSKNYTYSIKKSDAPPSFKGEDVTGATRMASDKENGVVDSNCKMHDVDNLYIAGGSVMPKAGWANPTLTIIALALRLADHLKGP